MRARRFVIIALMVAAALPARAFIRPYYKQTVGTGKYVGETASVDAGGDLHVKPQFSSYHSSTSSGTFNTYSLKASYDFDRYGIELRGGFTPTVNNYNNHFVGGAASVSFDFEPPESDTATVAVGPEPPEKKSKRPLIRRLDLSAGLTQTTHREIVTTPASVSGNKAIPARNNTDDIGETDVDGSAALTISDWVASLSVTKAAYDKDLARIGAKAASVVKLAGLASTIQGFPDYSTTLRFEFDRWLVAPYVSYTYTKFKVTQPQAVAYDAGASADWDWLALDASVERYAQAGAADLNYYSLAVKLRF